MVEQQDRYYCCIIGNPICQSAPIHHARTPSIQLRGKTFCFLLLHEAGCTDWVMLVVSTSCFVLFTICYTMCGVNFIDRSLYATQQSKIRHLRFQH